MASINPFDAVDAGAWEDVVDALELDPTLAEARDENGLSLLLMSLYHRRADVAAKIESKLRAVDLFESAALGRTEDLERHIDDGALVTALSPDGFTPLHLAAFFDRPGAAELLIERGADPAIPAQNPSRVQPIHSAVAGRSAEVVDLLIASGVDLDAPQMGGWTALHTACKNGLEGIARALVSGGADLYNTVDSGETPRDMLAPGTDPAAYGLGAE